MNKILLMAALALAGCAGRSDQGSGVGCGDVGSAYPCERSLVAVIANPDLYKGRLVRTAGFVSGGESRNLLFMSREGWAAGDRFSSIVVDVEQGAEVPEFSFVVVTGVIQINDAVRQPKIRIVVTEGANIATMYSPEDWSAHERDLMTGLREKVMEEG